MLRMSSMTYGLKLQRTASTTTNCIIVAFAVAAQKFLEKEYYYKSINGFAHESDENSPCPT